LVHGYGEHLGRYAHVAGPMAEAGFEVHGVDFRGHGKSGGLRGFCRAFDEYLEDLDAVRRAAEGPGPLFLVAHSFGGLTTLKYLLAHGDGVAGTVLSSPYFKLKMEVPPPKRWAGKVMGNVWPTLAMPMGLKGTDVSHDPEMQRSFESDPLSNKKATARWFTETLSAQADVLARAREVTLPLYLLHGGADPIADPARASEIFSLCASKDKTLELLDGQLHEIFNETKAERDRTISKVVAWLSHHIEGATRGITTPQVA
jgi:alpha-beta hydrolase superfamily lysophospholipase